jgi:hypothetical protein
MRRLQEKTKNLNLDKDVVINKALEDYFYIDKLNQLRDEVKGKAIELDMENEEDIFKANL